MNRLFALLLVLTTAFVFGYRQNISSDNSLLAPKIASAQDAVSSPAASHGQDGTHNGTSSAVAPKGPGPSVRIEPAASGAFVPYPDDNPERLSGIWREGKAVFSDYKFLDMFVPEQYARGNHPKQPINFSHQLHVEKNQMECQYCHSGVAKAAYPTMPSVELCMGCHKLVKTESSEIQKLKKYYDEGKPVEWVPVHNLPEHAHFPHERHIKAGVGCQNCHGQIQKMQAAERVSSLKMGWCLSCHREKGATIDCSACHY